jgi:hypothetical protein
MSLGFGYHKGFAAEGLDAEAVRAAWGTRMIVSQDGYTDFLGNRTSAYGSEEDKDALFEWVNRGAFKAARERAEALLKSYEMRTRECSTRTTKASSSATQTAARATSTPRLGSRATSPRTCARTMRRRSERRFARCLLTSDQAGVLT